nr:MAG TPA: hypothetical protein [Caudoviricetes sp.]
MIIFGVYCRYFRRRRCLWHSGGRYRLFYPPL